MQVEFIIVRYTDSLSSQPLQIWTFAADEEKEALKFYDDAQAQWSECYFCRVLISDETKRKGLKRI